MKLRRIVSCMMALLLVCSLPLAAFAEEYDLAQGSVTVNATESGQTVTHGSNAAVPDSAPVITQSNSSTPTTNTVTINADAGATANVTLSGVNINTSGAAVEIKGNGDVVIELDGSNTVQSGDKHAGVEKNTTDDSGNGNLTITDENGTAGSLEATGGLRGAGIGGGEAGNGSNIEISGSAEVTANGGHSGSGIGGGSDGGGSDITITGSAEVTAQGKNGGAGIGGGFLGSGSNIEITGSAEVTATGGTHGAGIGGGVQGIGSDITVSQDAQVKAQGGNATGSWGKGAAIGNGGAQYQNGQEVAPNTNELTPNGKIEYYAPGADIKTADPTKTVTGTYVPPQPTEPAQPAAPYRVVGQDGKNLACKKAQSSGVLTITVDADFATLTGSASGLKTLKAQGVETVVFVTTGATSTFALADLLAQVPSGSTYALTHVGSTVTLTLSSGMDISSILK